MKDFLCLSDWSLADLEKMFALAKELKGKQKAGEPHKLLEGKTLGMLFEKSSTRTRVSFEVGMFQLGGRAVSGLRQHPDGARRTDQGHRPLYGPLLRRHHDPNLLASRG